MILKKGNRTKITADPGVPIPRKDIAETQASIAKAMKEVVKNEQKKENRARRKRFKKIYKDLI